MCVTRWCNWAAVLEAFPLLCLGMCAYMCARVCARICGRICVRLCMCICARACVRMCVRMRVRVYVRVAFVCSYPLMCGERKQVSCVVYNALCSLLPFHSSLLIFLFSNNLSSVNTRYSFPFLTTLLVSAHIRQGNLPAYYMLSLLSPLFSLLPSLSSLLPFPVPDSPSSVSTRQQTTADNSGQ
jgi:hypothetical protein